MKHIYLIPTLIALNGCSDHVCNAILSPIRLTPSPVAMRVGSRQVVEASRGNCDGKLDPVPLVWTIVDTSIAVVNASSGEVAARSAGQTILRGVDAQSGATAVDTVRVLP